MFFANCITMIQMVIIDNQYLNLVGIILRKHLRIASSRYTIHISAGIVGHWVDLCLILL